MLVPGGIAQLGERVLCKHEVVGSIPSASTINFVSFPDMQYSNGIGLVLDARSNASDLLRG